MPKSRFIFSLVIAQAPKKKLKSNPNIPIPTNLTPLQIKIQPARPKSKEPLFEFVAEDQQDWPQQSKAYIQIWEVDKWKEGRRKGKEYDTSAQKTGNDLVVEFGGFIKKDGPKKFRFVSDGPVSPSPPVNKQNRSIVLMVDTLEKNQVSQKKVSLPVTGENELCFEIGIVCEKSAGQKRYKNQYNRNVYHILAHDDCICYLSNSSNPSSRCGADRIHYYIEAWMGHDSDSEDFYKFKYRNLSIGTFVSLGSTDSLENLLRKVEKDLSKTSNKNKKLGDLVILTHGKTFTIDNKLDTVKMLLPLFSLSRSIPMWELPKMIDAAEINKLLQNNSDYYNYVDGKGVKDGLISVVVKAINTHVDDKTHIWFAGCNLGLNKKFMQAVRKLFADKAIVFAFSKSHYIYVWKDSDQKIIKGRESLIYPGKRHVKIWTSEGIQSIVHVP